MPPSSKSVLIPLGLTAPEFKKIINIWDNNANYNK